MSKTAEIKLRVTTIEKEWWQQQAAEENTTVSALIRRVMNERVTAKPVLNASNVVVRGSWGGFGLRLGRKRNG